MADVKISQLAAASSVADDNVLPMVASGVSVKVSASQLKQHAIGSTSISGIGDGTPTGAISTLNTKITNVSTEIDNVGSSLAYLQVGNQATKTYANGDRFVYNGLLCKATAAIPEGNVLVLESNYTPDDTVLDKIDAIKSTIASIETDIAPVENGSTASKAYAIGEQFIKNDVLYKAKTAIAQGATLTINTNYELASDMTTQVNSLKQDLSDEVSARSQLGAKNRLPLKLEQIKIYNTTGTWNGDTYTHNGIDFTLLFDSNNQIIGVNVNGTASDNAMFSLNQNVWSDFDFIMNGATAHTTLMVQNQNWSTFIEVTGNNDAVVKKDSTNTTIRKIAIWVTSGYSVSNEVVYPMFRLPSDSDKTYQPYAMTNQELTQDLKKGNILANAKAWPSDTLAFTLPQDNAKLYHFVAFSAIATPQSDPASCVDAYFNIRTESVRYKVLSSDTISATYSDGVLTISLPANSYWLYKMELIKETTD